MTKKQKKKFLCLCKQFDVKPSISRYYEICHKTLINKIHATARKERLHDGYYWLIDKWILEYNRRHGTTQYGCPEDLKTGLARTEQNPVDFLYERYQQIKKYRKKKWFKKKGDEYDNY